MQTTKKSINEQIAEIHQEMDKDIEQTIEDTKDKSWYESTRAMILTLHHHDKVILQHIMKLEAKAYFIQKKLDETLGLRPRPQD